MFQILFLLLKSKCVLKLLIVDNLFLICMQNKHLIVTWELFNTPIIKIRNLFEFSFTRDEKNEQIQL